MIAGDPILGWHGMKGHGEQILPQIRWLLLPNLVSGVSDIAPDFKGQGEKWFLSVFTATSALLYRNDLQGWADVQIACFGLFKDCRARLWGGPSWRGSLWLGLASLAPSSPVLPQGTLAGNSPGTVGAQVMPGCLVPWDPLVPALPSPLLPHSWGWMRGNAVGRTWEQQSYSSIIQFR